MASAKEQLWVVLHCGEDDSHVLLTDDKVVYAEDLRVGEEVNFAYPGYRKMLLGIVRGISADRDEMVKLQDSLNCKDKPPREKSFHEDKRRRAAAKCLEKGFGTGPSKKPSPDTKVGGKRVSPSTSSQGSGKAKRTKRKVTPQPVSVLQKLLHQQSNVKEDDTSSSSGNDTSDSDKDQEDVLFPEKSIVSSLDRNDSESDGSNAELTPEDLQTLRKIQKKMRVADYHQLFDISSNKQIESQATTVKDVTPPKTLSQNHSSGMNSGSGLSCSKNVVSAEDQKKPRGSNGQVASVTPIPDKLLKETMNHSKSNTHPDKSTKPQESPGARVGPRRIPKKAPPKTDFISIVYEGESLIYKKDGQVAGTEKLHNDYKVFIQSKDLKKLKSNCNSPSALTRGLMRKIFKLEAREICSVSGKPSVVKGQTKPEKRTALDQDGVEAIIDFVQARSEKRGWRVPTDANVKQYMGNLLCEERAAKTLAEQEQPTEETVEKEVEGGKEGEEKKTGQGKEAVEEGEF